MNAFLILITNRIFLSSFAGWFLSQLIKSFINFLKTKKFSIKQFVDSGGFPSSHSATVSALLTSLFILQGISNLFVVSLIFSLIVIKNTTLREKTTRHNLKEILAGIIIGFLVGIIISKA